MPMTAAVELTSTVAVDHPDRPALMMRKIQKPVNPTVAMPMGVAGAAAMIENSSQ